MITIQTEDASKKIINNFEGVPAIVYFALWQTRKLGFLKEILKEKKIKNVKILLFFEDYKPGALITLDAEKGDFFIDAVDSIENLQYDTAVIGEIGPLLKIFEGNIILRAIGVFLKKKVRIKSKLLLLKILNL